MSSTETIRKKLITMYPEFAPKPGNNDELARIDMFIDNARLSVDTDVWGVKADLGIMYLAAHNLSQTKPGGTTSGVIVEEEKENNRVRYLVPSVRNFGEFGVTKYGRSYESLKNSLFVGGFIF